MMKRSMLYAVVLLLIVSSYAFAGVPYVSE
jgi:hypothetical protein